MKKFAAFCVFSVLVFLGIVGFMRKKTLDSAKDPVVVEDAALKASSEERFSVTAEEDAELKPAEDELSRQEVDLVDRFFTTGKEQFPIVHTIKYKSRVPWLKGKQAWIADYAAHYKTSRHFIARSLNRKKDYLTQAVAVGDKFTVFALEKPVRFYLVIDLSRCKMWFYYHDLDANEQVLVKTYRVGVGRLDPKADSGVLTPVGQYVLGDKVASYKPSVVGLFQGVETEMVQVFGTRWLPLAKEVESGEEIRGYGLHGVPWIYDEKTKTYVEDAQVIGHYTSDGCIRLKQEDIEELYAIVLTKETLVEIVTDFSHAQLPGACESKGNVSVRSRKTNL